MSTRRRDERGSVIVIVAIAMTVLLVATAFSFDIGRQVDKDRSMQAVADAVALSSAQFLDGTAAGSVDTNTNVVAGNTLAAVVEYEASESALDNGYTPGGSTFLKLGTCSSTTSAPCTFEGVESCPSLITTSGAVSSPPATSNCTPLTGASSTVINAVQVAASGQTKFVFSPGTGESVRYATATAGGTPQSAFTIGSTLLSVNSQQSAILTALLGPDVTLDALSYQGLADADVTLGELVDANTGVASLNSLLTSQVTSSTVIGYLANALGAEATQAEASGDTSLNSALAGAESTLADIPGTSGSTTFEFCKLLGLNTSTNTCGSTEPAASASVSVLSLLTGAAELSNGTNGVSLDLTSLGLGTVTVSLISPPAAAGPGPVGISATDTQGTVDVSLDVAGLADISFDVTAAQATGTLNDIDCDSSPQTVTIGVSTTALEISTPSITLVGTNVDLNSLLQVSLAIDPGSVKPLPPFQGPFEAGSPVPETTLVTAPTVTINAQLLGLSLLSIPSSLTTLLGSLSSYLVPILQALGVNVGSATVTDNYLSCGSTLAG